MSSARRSIVLALVAASVMPGRAEADVSAGAFAAGDLRLETLRLGQPIVEFETQRAKTLCDRDPIEGRTRTIWFHAPKPCREAEPLPEKTIVVLYTKTKAPTDPLDAIAWFGDWPKVSGNFPLAVGVGRAAADKALGAGKRLFDFAGVVDGGDAIVVWRHAGGVHSIVQGGKVLGYVAGTMGDDGKREEWRGLISNVLRYLK